jgi:hypothetical protein
MAVQIAFVFQSPDRTDYLNQRLAGLVSKGIYSGAELTPTGSGLTATRGPFFALGKDGITIWDNEVGTFAYTTGQANYHCIYAKYNPLGTPSTPVVQEVVLTTTGYNTHPDKAYLIVVAVVTPAGAVLLNSEIDYSLRDEVGPFGRAQLRGVVDTEAELPTSSPNWNRSGDLYICNNDPAPGGGGLYMWEGATLSWRLVAARGAATLDGAYDNNGAGGPPGYGRWIEVDAQAVELLQDNTSQRENDIANAALRIRKTGTSIAGDVGLDVVMAKDKDVGGLLVRSLYTSGTYIQQDEPVNVSGSTITGTRGGATWNHSTIHRAHIAFVEISNSTQGNDGLYVALPTGPNTCDVRTLDSATPTLTTETGITANFFSLRYSVGTPAAKFVEYDWASYKGIVEFLGNAALGTAVGKVTYYTPGTMSWVWQVRATNAGAGSTATCLLTDGGSLYVRPLTAYIDGHTVDSEMSHASYAAVKAHHTGTGHGVRATSVDGYGVYAKSDNYTGLYAETNSGSWAYPAIRVQAFTATGVWASVTGTNAALLGSSSAVGGTGVWAELQNAGDTTGRGLYAKHAGGGTSIFSETLGASNGIAVHGKTAGDSLNLDPFSPPLQIAAGIRGEGDGSNAIGVMGEHYGPNFGWGGLFWNNNTDTTKGAIDGFAWGEGPGVYASSVFGPGIRALGPLIAAKPGLLATALWDYGVRSSGYGYDAAKTISVAVPLQQLVEDYGSTETWVVLQSTNPTDSPVRLYNRTQLNKTAKFLWDGLPHNAIINHVDVMWYQNGNSSGDEMRMYVQKHSMGQTSVGGVFGDATIFTDLNTTQQYVEWSWSAYYLNVHRFTCNVSTADRTFNRGTDLLNITIKSCGDSRDAYVYWIRVNFTFELAANYPAAT